MKKSVIWLIILIIAIVVILSILIGFENMKSFNTNNGTSVPININNETSININNGTLIFEKKASWGPCPKNTICHQNTQLYSPGILILEGDKNLNKEIKIEDFNNIINKIRTSGILEKNCSAEPTLDYSAKYYIFLDNKNVTMNFPGCQTELNEVDNLISSL